MLELLQAMGPSRQLASEMGREEPAAFKVRITDSLQDLWMEAVQDPG